MSNYDDLSAVSIVELLAANNWQSQYRLITQWGRLIEHKPELRRFENLLKGCETPAWLSHSCHQDKHYFSFDSDSRVINGLAALLLSQMHGKTAEEISLVNFTALLKQVGLEKHLTPSRNNGLNAIMQKARALVSEQPV